MVTIKIVIITVHGTEYRLVYSIAKKEGKVSKGKINGYNVGDQL